MVQSTLLNRRKFMQLLAIAAAAYPLSGLAGRRQQALVSDSVSKEEPWLTISAVQEHLFPAEKNSPGASDINALVYLQNMMVTPDFENEKGELIHNGVTWLNDLAKQQHSKTFIQLDSTTKEKILRHVENSNAGSRWLSTLLTYLIEALLSDPVYQGNPNGIGWNWLQHQPGFPLPTENKKYFKIGKNRYRHTKA